MSVKEGEIRFQLKGPVLDFRLKKPDIKLKKPDFSDEAKFIKSWLDNPLKTGALSPSGKDLARAMAEPIDLSVPGDIVELGPGTGPVTEAMLARGVPAERLILVEYNADFIGLLKSRFPGVRVVQGDAYHIVKTLDGACSAPLAAVVSSLPLITRPDAQRLKLLNEAFSIMHPRGVFIQFTYGPVSPVPLKGQFFAGRGSKRIWMNLPPARVWTYRPKA